MAGQHFRAAKVEPGPGAGAEKSLSDQTARRAIRANLSELKDGGDRLCGFI